MLSTTTTNARKRKSTGGLDALGKQDDGNKRRKTLDSFFTPQVTIASPNKQDKGSYEVLTLNTEQQRVLQMVVHEGKNVFFTGAAGASISPLPRLSASLWL